MKSKTLPAWARLVCTAAAALVFLLAYELVCLQACRWARFTCPPARGATRSYYAKQLSAVVTARRTARVLWF